MVNSGMTDPVCLVFCWRVKSSAEKNFHCEAIFFSIHKKVRIQTKGGQSRGEHEMQFGNWNPGFFGMSPSISPKQRSGWESLPSHYWGSHFFHGEIPQKVLYNKKKRHAQQSVILLQKKTEKSKQIKTKMTHQNQVWCKLAKWHCWLPLQHLQQKLVQKKVVYAASRCQRIPGDEHSLCANTLKNNTGQNLQNTHMHTQNTKKNVHFNVI